jgi:hypothetical protein
VPEGKKITLHTPELRRVEYEVIIQLKGNKKKIRRRVSGATFSLKLKPGSIKSSTVSP